MSPTPPSVAEQQPDSEHLPEHAPFAGGHDYAATLERLIDEAGEAQDGRAVRVFQRFYEAVDRGYASLHPRPYDPGESPLTGGPLLDSRWEDEAFALYERVMEAHENPPADADQRWERHARYVEGLAEVFWSCCADGPRSRAMRAEAYVTALESLDNADENGVRFHRALADSAWADSRLGTAQHNLGAQIDALGDHDPDLVEDRVRALETAAKAYTRAVDRRVKTQRHVDRAWAAVQTSWRQQRRPQPPTVKPRNRSHRQRRAASRRASGQRSGQDPGEPPDEDDTPGLATRRPKWGEQLGLGLTPPPRRSNQSVRAIGRQLHTPLVGAAPASFEEFERCYGHLPPDEQLRQFGSLPEASQAAMYARLGEQIAAERRGHR